MAGLFIRGNTGEIAFTSAGGTKTIAQIVAANNHRVRVHKIKVSFKGTNGVDAPVLVEILRQSTAGTMSSLTLKKALDSDDETIQTTAQHTATVEPTAGDVLDSQSIHPQTSYDFRFDRLDDQYIKGGGRLGVRVNTPAQDGTVNVSLHLEE